MLAMSECCVGICSVASSARRFVGRLVMGACAQCADGRRCWCESKRVAAGGREVKVSKRRRGKARSRRFEVVIRER